MTTEDSFWRIPMRYGKEISDKTYTKTAPVRKGHRGGENTSSLDRKNNGGPPGRQRKET